jgi:hypothetical protein
MRTVTSAAALALAMIAGTASAAILTYDVSSTPVVNCGSAPHGLWTNRLFGGACGNYFDIQPGSKFIVDTAGGTATLTGSAINPQGKVASFALSLGGFLETTHGSGFIYKKEGGPAYDPVTDAPDIDFFTTGSGTISIDGVDYTLNLADPFTSNTLFQFGGDDGIGANAKNGDFGASAWINMLDASGRALAHWDFNINLKLVTDKVPEPAALALFGLGLVGLAIGRRRQR